VQLIVAFAQSATAKSVLKVTPSQFGLLKSVLQCFGCPSVLPSQCQYQSYPAGEAVNTSVRFGLLEEESVSSTTQEDLSASLRLEFLRSTSRKQRHPDRGDVVELNRENTVLGAPCEYERCGTPAWAALNSGRVSHQPIRERCRSFGPISDRVITSIDVRRSSLVSASDSPSL
jgi:hypothetical protein